MQLKAKMYQEASKKLKVAKWWLKPRINRTVAKRRMVAKK